MVIICEKDEHDCTKKNEHEYHELTRIFLFTTEAQRIQSV